MTETAVGMTQLTVSGNQGHPYLSGLNWTARSTVRNFHFQNQRPSRPLLPRSQRIDFSIGAVGARKKRKAITTSAVVQHPSGSSPTNAGQLPSAFCVLESKSIPRA